MIGTDSYWGLEPGKHDSPKYRGIHPLLKPPYISTQFLDPLISKRIINFLPIFVKLTCFWLNLRFLLPLDHVASCFTRTERFCLNACTPWRKWFIGCSVNESTCSHFAPDDIRIICCLWLMSVLIGGIMPLTSSVISSSLFISASSVMRCKTSDIAGR